MMQISNIREAIDNLMARIVQANRAFDRWIDTDDEFFEPSWLIEACFLQLLAISEALELEEFRKMVHSEYSSIKNSNEGFSKGDTHTDGTLYSISLSRIRRFVLVLESFFPEKGHIRMTADPLQIIRDIHYVITNKDLFGTTPANESDVHIRIEGILKCVFPDLKTKPILTKQIKNFEPDTGIPSIETLIEYKFLSRKEDIGVIADQILADTRGYTSKDWKHFLYVIYETNRFRTEKDWNQLLKQSGVPENTTVVVLSGEPTTRKKRNK